RSMLAVMLTETGLMPIRVRRLLLSDTTWILGDDSDRVVHAALLDSVDLFHTGFAGWAGDLAIMPGTLPTPICVMPADFLSIPTIEAIMVEVAQHISPLEDPLLRDRLEAVDETHSLVTRRRRTGFRTP
ncbi:hypothetical protein DFH09DRAFT_929109, partial [Mycena vulgaris]